MVYRFTFISDEDDAFVRIIDADSEATFFDLHKAIQKSVESRKVSEDTKEYLKTLKRKKDL